MWAITPHCVIKSGVILTKGAGAITYVLLEGDDIPVFLPLLRDLCLAFVRPTLFD